MTALQVADAVWRAVNAHGHTGLELEFRLGHRLPGGAFTSNVGKDTFGKIMESLEASAAWDAVYDIDTVDMIHSGAKHVTTTSYAERGGVRAPAPPPPRWLTKTKVATVDYETGDALAARASVSIEAFAPADPDPPPTTSRRIKSRRRFQWKCWAFDLTKVQSTLPGDLDNDDFSYEVEIELVDPGMLFERTMDSIAEWGMALVNDLLQMLK
jgi:hypothetical protein